MLKSCDKREIIIIFYNIINKLIFIVLLNITYKLKIFVFSEIFHEKKLPIECKKNKIIYIRKCYTSSENERNLMIISFFFILNFILED